MSFQPIPPEELLYGYAHGIFPMSPARGVNLVEWYQPAWRGIFPLAEFHLSKNTLRAMRRTPHEVVFDGDFRGVMQRCAERDTTWISDLIIESYVGLHQLGHAHSVEIRIDGEPVGGLYGVSMGGAFFGESMYQLAPDAAKFALYYCWERLVERGFVLWDTQYYTPHLGTFGCAEISQRRYLRLLAAALKVEATFHP